MPTLTRSSARRQAVSPGIAAAYLTTETGIVTMLLAAVAAVLIIRHTEESQP